MLCSATFSLSWLGVLDLYFAVGASSKPRSVWLMTALWFLPKFPKATVLCHTPVLWHIPQAGKQREIPHKWRPYYVFFLLTRVVENRMLSESWLHAVYRSHDACMLSRCHFRVFLWKVFSQPGLANVMLMKTNGCLQQTANQKLFACTIQNLCEYTGLAYEGNKSWMKCVQSNSMCHLDLLSLHCTNPFYYLNC